MDASDPAGPRIPVAIDRGPEPQRPVEVERWSPQGRQRGPDVVAAEEPLQIVLDGEPFAVVMRTPGHDLELVLGLLFVEGLIRAREDLGDGAVAASSIPADDVPFPVRALPEAENLVELRLVR